MRPARPAPSSCVRNERQFFVKSARGSLFHASRLSGRRPTLTRAPLIAVRNRSSIGANLGSGASQAKTGSYRSAIAGIWTS